MNDDEMKAKAAAIYQSGHNMCAIAAHRERLTVGIIIVGSPFAVPMNEHGGQMVEVPLAIAEGLVESLATAICMIHQEIEDRKKKGTAS